MATGPAMSAAFLAVVMAFIGSTVWSQRANQRASDAALAISKDVVPEIELIADTRARLRLLEARVLRRVAGEESEVPAARAHLDQSLLRSRALLTTENERDGFDRVQAAVQAFELSAERAIEQSRLGARSEATRTVRIELRRQADEADAEAAALVSLEARRAQVAAEGVESAIGTANRLAFRLDALSGLLSVAAALLVLRIVRAAARASDEHRQLVERKAAELEMFAGRVAHDILGPLNTVAMAISIAQRDPSLQQARGALSRGASSLGRVSRIVDGLLSFARAGAQPEPGVSTEVGPVVAGLKDELTELAAQEDAVLVVEPFRPCAVECSQGVLLSLLSNLLRNALKYLGDSRQRQVTLRVLPQRGAVRFEVEDTGPGIPAALADTVFQPYVRGHGTGKPGIGLGLATVKRLVDSHGGKVSLRRAPDGGARFCFDLAAVDLPSDPAAAPSQPQHAESPASSTSP